jgi:hypothetical protein
MYGLPLKVSNGKRQNDVVDHTKWEKNHFHKKELMAVE